MNNFSSTIKYYMLEYKLNLSKSDKSDNVLKILNKYIEILIFNVVSVAAIITMINNSQSINKETVNLVKLYINEKCNNIKITTGGTVLPSEYFGYDSGSYSENNITNDVLNINFQSGILRNQIGGGSGRDNKKDTELILNKIDEILNYYKLTASAIIKKNLLVIINKHINCFFLQLKSLDVINKSSINKLIKSNKSLDIFK